MIATSPLDLILRDLFLRLDRFVDGHDVFLKLEGFNVTGSIKVTTAIAMLDDAEARGLVRRGRSTIVESSSGNLGVALALVCARRGYRFVCVTDPNVARSNLIAMRAYGAQVVVVEERDAGGGYLAARFAEIRRILAADADAHWLNQYANPANKAVHARETAREILAAFPRVDWIFVGTGTSGTFTGIAEALRDDRPSTRVVAVDPVGSVTFGGSAPAPRAIPGIGASERPPIADGRLAHAILYVDEPTTVASCRALVRDHGLLAGGSTGSVLAGVRQLARDFRPGETIVAISPDLGEKYLETVYDDDWVAAHISPAPLPAIVR